MEDLSKITIGTWVFPVEYDIETTVHDDGGSPKVHALTEVAQDSEGRVYPDGQEPAGAAVVNRYGESEIGHDEGSAHDLLESKLRRQIEL